MESTSEEVRVESVSEILKNVQEKALAGDPSVIGILVAVIVVLLTIGT